MIELVNVVISGNIDKVMDLVDNNEYMKKTSFDNSALEIALQKNYDDIAELLIKAKAYLVKYPGSSRFRVDPPLPNNCFVCEDDLILETEGDRCRGRGADAFHELFLVSGGTLYLL